MTERSGVFLLQNNDSLVGMEPAQFAAEDDFQRLLSRFPELLVGDQVDPQSPRRWMLVRREQPVATEAGTSQWSIDHLFLDQDGVPTLVEVKRQSDSRIRREVVGQMLDYAANCATHWSIETLQAGLEKTCSETGKASDEVISNLVGPDGTAQDFWQRVKTNLQAGNIRLLFVADIIPLELRRIVEFLNQQMNPAEVLAIELRQFSSGELETLVPTVYGQTQAAVQKRAPAGRQWDEASFFDTLAATVGSREVEVARAVFNWMREGNRQLVYGTGQSGSVYPLLRPAGVRINPVYLTSNGKIYIQFGALQDKPVFGEIEARRALMERLNNIVGVNLTEADLAKYPAITLATIASDPEGLSKLLGVLRWMDSQMAAA